MGDRVASSILVIVCAFLALVSAVWALIDVSMDSRSGSSGASLKKDARSLLGLLAAASATGLASALIGVAS